MRSHFLLPALGAALLACQRTAGVTPRSSRDSGASHGPVVARDTALEQRAARLELRVLEKEAQVAELQVRLDEARQEVVRAMAKLQTVASKAEAASALAEAEIALQTVRAATGDLAGPDLDQATDLLRQGTVEFGKQNYGGALYLANQAKSVAGVGKGRPGDPVRVALRPGETPFAVPIRLQAAARGNVREGPGSGFRVLFTVEAGAPLVGHSSTDQWVRVTDDAGRGGWIHVTLVARRPSGGR